LLGLACAAIAGHSFPVWLKFRGGKGVATSLGVFLALIPGPTAMTFLFWCLVFVVSRIISVASLLAAIFFPLAVFLFQRSRADFPVFFGVACVLTVFIFFTHRANIRRLMRGEEKKLL
jgi:acyl phosphate:glycerol-3-phosphate acyltransferase